MLDVFAHFFYVDTLILMLSVYVASSIRDQFTFVPHNPVSLQHIPFTQTRSLAFDELKMQCQKWQNKNKDKPHGYEQLLEANPLSTFEYQRSSFSYLLKIFNTQTHTKKYNIHNTFTFSFFRLFFISLSVFLLSVRRQQVSKENVAWEKDNSFWYRILFLCFLLHGNTFIHLISRHSPTSTNHSQWPNQVHTSLVYTFMMYVESFDFYVTFFPLLFFHSASLRRSHFYYLSGSDCVRNDSFVVGRDDERIAKKKSNNGCGFNFICEKPFKAEMAQEMCMHLMNANTIQLETQNYTNTYIIKTTIEGVRYLYTVLCVTCYRLHFVGVVYMYAMLLCRWHCCWSRQRTRSAHIICNDEME